LFKFSSETSAEAALHDLEEYVPKSGHVTNIESQLASEFIEITGEQAIDVIDFIPR